MRWQRGTSDADIEDRRGASGGGLRGGFPGGGGLRLGLGGIIVLGLLSLVFKQNFFTLLDQVPAGGAPMGGPSAPPTTTTAEEDERFEFVKFVLNDVQDTWSRVLPQQGAQYQKATLVVFRNAVQSACGFAEAATGPFYCPGDQKV